MAGSRLVLVVAAVLLLSSGAVQHVHAAARANKALRQFALDLSVPPKRTPQMTFNDAWTAKLVGTDAGNKYRPDLVDWASVIQAVRVICNYESRICNWCTRAVFHDGGANVLDDVGATVGVRKNQVVTAPPGGGGLDASLLLTNETLRPENAYDSFSTFVAAVIRTLVGFYDISYADGLAVCGAVARESLSYGAEPVYNMMPAVDTSFPGKDKKLQTQNFLVGRLDQNTPNGEGILPGATFNVAQFADWFEKRFARGVYDGVALLGSHALLDDQGCVKSAETSGPFQGKKRMFSWNAPKTYYKELMTPRLERSLDDRLDSTLFRTDAPKVVFSVEDWERCKFTSKAFADAAVSSLDLIAAANPGGDDPEPSFDWVDPDTMFPADEGYVLPQPEQIDPATFDASTVVSPQSAGFVAEAGATVQPTTRRRRSLQQAGNVDPAEAEDPTVLEEEEVEDPTELEEVEAPEDEGPEEVVGPRPAGYRLRRVCDSDNQCFDGWPYTQNDGYLGQAAQNSSFTDADSVAVRDAVLKMQNPKQFSASYGHAFIRLINNGAAFTPAGPSKSKGVAITGWECANWVAGDGKNAAKNLVCKVGCRLKGGCPNLMAKVPPVPTAVNCRCSTSPWGDVANQKLFPNSTQTAWGGILATPSGLVGRKMLAAHSEGMLHPGGATAAAAGGTKAKCPFASLKEAGLLRGLGRR